MQRKDPQNPRLTKIALPWGNEQKTALVNFGGHGGRGGVPNLAGMDKEVENQPGRNSADQGITSTLSRQEGADGFVFGPGGSVPEEFHIILDHTCRLWLALLFQDSPFVLVSHSIVIPATIVIQVCQQLSELQTPTRICTAPFE